MAEDKFWSRHCAFLLFSVLVLISGLYVACSGTVGDSDIEKTGDGGTDAPRSNR